jgi:ATP-dependent DNA ligase
MTAPETMEALLVEQLPDGAEWLFEPKWDGFRCLALRNGTDVALWSRSGKPLGRYFPEVEAQIRALPQQRFLLDGELVVPTSEGLSFEALSQRLHPAASRVARLSAETPAMLIAFDLLEEGTVDLRVLPLDERRTRLERFLAGNHSGIALSPQTSDRQQALGWLERSGGALDGVIAKRANGGYRPGERAMLKVKQHRTADCVVGGFRFDAKGEVVASLLLGLHDDKGGLLHHVGFCSSLSAEAKRQWTELLDPLRGGAGFTGDKPGKPSRWDRGRAAEWEPVEPVTVVEVRYDQVTAGRFRHGTTLVRTRPDKRPDQCRCEQLRHPLTPLELAQLLAFA